MKLADIIKCIVSIAVPAGTGTFVGHYTKAAMTGATKVEKVCVMIAGSAISGLIADKAVDHFNKNVDETFAQIDNFKNNRKKKKLAIINEHTGKVEEVIEVE